MTGVDPAARYAKYIEYCSIGLIVAFALTGIVLQSHVPLNHDVAWVGHSAGWLLEGKHFGVDILDPSPPLAWYLNLPAAVMYRTGYVSEITAIRFWFWVLCAGSMILSFRILDVLPANSRGGERLVLIVASAVALCILPARDFGQRDVTGLLLGLPYLFLVAGQLEFRRSARTSDAVMAGVAAGIGFSLKPFMLVIPVLLEIFKLLRSGRLRVQLTPELTSMLVVCATYGVCVILFSPAYLVVQIPIIKAVYWAYDASSYWMISRLESSIAPLILGTGVALATQSVNSYHGAIGIACIGAVASYLAQGKGFTYHAYPILALGWLFLAYSALVGSKRLYSTVRKALGTATAILGLLALAVALKGVLFEPIERSLEWFQSNDMERGERGRVLQSTIDQLRDLGVGPGEFLYALTTHPGPGFPLVNYLGTEWAGQAATQFMLPAYVRREEIAGREERELVDSLAMMQIEQVTSALAQNLPRVVLVDRRPNRLGIGARRFSFVDFYSRDSDFRKVWACYSEATQIDDIALFVRDDSCHAKTLQAPTQRAQFLSDH